MAEPIDSAIVLGAVQEAAIRVYGTEFLRQTWVGKMAEKTNRFFMPSKDALVGDGKYFKIKRGPTDNVRFGRELNASFAPPKAFDPAEIKVRVNMRDASASDVVRIGVSIRCSLYDLRGISSEGMIVNLVDEMMMDSQDGFGFKLAASRHLPRSGLIGSIGSTPKNTDTVKYANASTYTSGSSSCKIQVSGGSIGVFKQNFRYDIYNGSTLVASNMRCTDVDTSEVSGTIQGTVDLAVTSDSVTSGGGAVTNCNGIASGHSLYFTGNKDNNIYSLGAWFSNPSAGDSFIGGVDRTSSSNRYLIPSNIRGEASSSRRIQAADFDAMGDAIGYVAGDTPLATLTDPRMVTSLRQDLGNDVMFTTPPNTPIGERQYAFGGMGVQFQHPTLGAVMLVGDPLAAPGTVRAIVPDDWTCEHYGPSDLEWVPGDGGNGYFYRMNDSTPGSGKTLIYQADGFAVLSDFCKFPKRQAQISNVSSS